VSGVFARGEAGLGAAFSREGSGVVSGVFAQGEAGL
jgi:hypothetical protein